MNKVIDEGLTFDDVLIKPRFSYIKSRQDTDISSNIGRTKLSLPVLSANMDTVTGPFMAQSMDQSGGLGVLHRFFSVDDNLQAYKEATDAGSECAVSFGLGNGEKDRALKLYQAGARILVLDVAHGAQSQVADQYMEVREMCPEAAFIVGNFASHESICDFILDGCGFDHVSHFPDYFKIGVGPGSACTTRIKTGVGVPQLTALLECAKVDIKFIADGGMRTPGDIAKALAAGASAVMIGGMLAGTDETPGDVVERVTGDLDEQKVFTTGNFIYKTRTYKKYRGSASKESYDAQCKDQAYITAEGESFEVPCKGPVSAVLQDIEGGLRSAFSYVGATNLKEFQEKAQFIKITASGVRENDAHGKKL